MEPWWCFGTMVTIHVIIGGMTVRKKDLNPALRRVGAIIKRHRIELIDIKPSRSDFIIDAVSPPTHCALRERRYGRMID